MAALFLACSAASFVARAPPLRTVAVVRPRAVVPVAQETAAPPKDLRAIFDEADADGSGELDSDELFDVLSASGLSLTKSQMSAIIETIDENGDGVISFDEFETAFDLGNAVTSEGLAATLRLKGACEVQRPFRRTVYGHDDWIQHRSGKRFLRNFVTTFEGGVARSLSEQLSTVTSFATFVVLANCLLNGYTDFSGVAHAAPLPFPLVKSLSLPPLPFTILGPALSLLLVFRTNTAYFRWNEARTLWGGIVNTCRNLQRQSNNFFPEDADGQELRQQLALQVAAFPKSLRSFLRGAEDDPIFKKDAIELLGPETAEVIMVSKNRPTFVCNLISATVQRANLNPMDRAQMDQNTNKLVDYLGACERIFKSPIPLVYTRHTSRFISWYVLLCPFALWGALGDSWNHWATIPAEFIIALFLFGIEELGIQIEEPFGILPLEAMSDGSIEGVVQDMRESYKKGHFGPIQPGSKMECGVVVTPTKDPAASIVKSSATLLEGASFADGGNELEPGGYVVSTKAPGWMKSILEDDLQVDEGTNAAETTPAAEKSSRKPAKDTADWFTKYKK